MPAFVLLGGGVLPTAIEIALPAAYLIPLIAVYGQTLGERLIGIQVVNKNNQAVPGWSRSIIRYLVLDGLGQVVNTINYSGFAWVVLVAGVAILNKRRQGLHDLTAGVNVVDRPIPLA